MTNQQKKFQNSDTQEALFFQTKSQRLHT